MVSTYIDKRTKINVFGLKTTTRMYNKVGELTRNQISYLHAQLDTKKYSFDRVRHEALIKAKIIPVGTPYIPSDFPVPEKYQHLPLNTTDATVNTKSETIMINETKPKVEVLMSFDPPANVPVQEVPAVDPAFDDASLKYTISEEMLKNITLGDIMHVVKQSQDLVSILLDNCHEMRNELRELRDELKALKSNAVDVVEDAVETPPIGSVKISTENHSEIHAVEPAPLHHGMVAVDVNVDQDEQGAEVTYNETEDYEEPIDDGLDDIIDEDVEAAANSYMDFVHKRRNEEQLAVPAVSTKKVLPDLTISNNEFKRRYGLKPKEVVDIVADIMNADEDVKSDPAEYFLYAQSIYQSIFAHAKNDLVIQYEDGEYEFNKAIVGDIFTRYQEALAEVTSS